MSFPFTVCLNSRGVARVRASTLGERTCPATRLAVPNIRNKTGDRKLRHLRGSLNTHRKQQPCPPIALFALTVHKISVFQKIFFRNPQSYDRVSGHGLPSCETKGLSHGEPNDRNKESCGGGPGEIEVAP